MKRLSGILIAAMMLIPCITNAHGPSRQKVEESIIINAAPEKVWKIVSNFAGLHEWHPAVVSTSMNSDTQRVLTIGEEGGPTITEDLKKLDDEKMMLKYKIVDMSTVKTVEYRGKQYDVPTVPVNNYLSIISVKAVEGGSEVNWTGKFYRVYQLNYDKVEPKYPEGLGDEEGVAAIQEIYKSGLENLKALIEGS
jgi:mxaD protein